MGEAIALHDLPWAGRRISRKALATALPLRVVHEAAVLEARIGARLSSLPEHVRANLASTLGADPSLPDPDEVARRYQVFSRVRGVVEALPGRRGFDDPDRWPIAGREHLDQALDRGRGALLCTAHFGWWLLLAPILRVHGYPVVRTGGPYFDRERKRWEERRRWGSRFRRWVRERTRTRLPYLGPDDIAAGLDVRPIFRALARNRPVQIAGDGRQALEFVEFPLLGRPYPLPTGFVKIALESGAPALPLFALEGERTGSVRIEIRPPLPFDPAAGAEENLGHYARVLDDELRRAPHLWRRWDVEDLYGARRAQAAAAYRVIGRTEAEADSRAGVVSEAGNEDGSRSK